MAQNRVPFAPLQPSPLATQQARPRVRPASRSPSPSARKKAKPPSSLWKQVVNLAFWSSPQATQRTATPDVPMADVESDHSDSDAEEEVAADPDGADGAATQPAKERRRHRKKNPLPNLPAGFIAGKESLGPLQHTPGGRAKPGEKVDVVLPVGHVCDADEEQEVPTAPSKKSKLLPDGSKPYRIDKRLTVKAHQRAENFARENKFISAADGMLRPPALRSHLIS